MIPIPHAALSKTPGRSQLSLAPSAGLRRSGWFGSLLKTLRCLAALALLGGLALAQAEDTPAAPPQLTEQDAAAWLDGLMPSALEMSRTPGAVVVIVKDGRVLLQRGYGHADLAKRTPVDPRTTLFRPGSTSKLFTWTSVMQLVEQGRIDLDADVNRYLDFTIAPLDGKPVTMRNIMTHRAGFEETIKDLLVFQPPAATLEQTVKRFVPARLFAPGTVPGYSNYATALAGYIVQRVSGAPFEQYVQRHIFAPLHMASSTFVQPLPPPLRARMATGYEETGKPGKGFELVGMAPAGALSSTGEDMARFMIAHLQQGRYGDAAILKPETARLMHGTVVRVLPDLNGNALGFYEQNINGQRVIAHGGDTNYFHSDLALFLDQQIGIFISVNATGKEGMGARIRERLFESFADRYFPRARRLQPIEPQLARAHAALLAGRYVSTRRLQSSFLSLVNLLLPVEVRAGRDGSVSLAMSGQIDRYVETRPFYWQQLDGHDAIQAIVADGKVLRWSSDRMSPVLALEPAAGWGGGRRQLQLATGGLLVLLAAALAWPAGAVMRRVYRQPLPLARRQRLAFHAQAAGAWLALAAAALWAGLFAVIIQTNATRDPAALLQLSQLAAFVGWGGGWGVALCKLMLDLTAGASRSRKAWDALVCAAFSAVLWVAASHHLLSFNADY